MNLALYLAIAIGVFIGFSEHPSTTKSSFHDKVLVSAAWPIILPAIITINQITELEENQPIIKKNK